MLSNGIVEDTLVEASSEQQAGGSREVKCTGKQARAYRKVGRKTQQAGIRHGEKRHRSHNKEGLEVEVRHGKVVPYSHTH